MQKADFTVRFGIHNNQIQVYARNKQTKKAKHKTLSFFWEDYQLQTELTHWDNKQQAFNLKIGRVPIPTASEDNKRLKELQNQLEMIIENSSCDTPDQLFTNYKTALSVEACKVPTLLEYTQTYCQLWKDGQVIIKGEKQEYCSGNWVIYRKLVKRLQGYQYNKLQPWAKEIERFANMPITEIDSKVANDFVHFLITKGLPLKDSYNAFRATVYYYHWERNDRGFRLILEKDLSEAIQKSKKRKKEIVTLTEKQLKDIASFDITTIRPKMKIEKKQLFKDTLLLMYGLATRPFDILTMKIEDIDKDENGYYWEYAATKIRNKCKADIMPISPNCMKILKKYIGNRKKGLVLPSSITNITAKDNEKEYNKRKAQVNHTATDIGNFLKDIARACNWDINANNLTMYNLRHTAITDLVKENNETIVAIWGHTSPQEVKRTYTDRKKLAKSKCPNNLSFM